MAPVHDPPLRFVGIVLEEEVRLTIIKNCTVRVIAPARRHGCVIMRSVTLTHFYLHSEAVLHGEAFLHFEAFCAFFTDYRIP